MALSAYLGTTQAAEPKVGVVRCLCATRQTRATGNASQRLDGSRRFVASLLLAVAATLARVDDADAGRRVALVVGNAAYRKFQPLGAPANDARAVSEALKQAGIFSTLSRRTSTWLPIIGGA